jgi:hypothetical protein
LTKPTNTIDALIQLASYLKSGDEQLNAAIQKSCFENLWFTKSNYQLALAYWADHLTKDKLEEFIHDHLPTSSPKQVGIIMAGNIPLVGMHDLLCVLLSGHIAIVKPSSEDKTIIKLLVKRLEEFEPSLFGRVRFVEQLQKDIEVVIATGSNNSFRYFEYYFSKVPNLLRKNRRSIAILDGSESVTKLELLSNDIFSYFGMGCRNVSLLFLPRSMDIVKVIDAFEGHADLINHNRYANNYTYHRALFLMNQQQHLDNGFVLLKEERSLKAPIGCLYYTFYDDVSEIELFVQEERENIQCIVGNYSEWPTVDYGKTQRPDLQDFADEANTLTFLSNL